MATKVKATYELVDVVSAAIIVYEDQGFVRSGAGHTEYDNDGNIVKEVKDNKTAVKSRLSSSEPFNPKTIKSATDLIDTFNSKMMLKKMSGSVSSFDENIIKCFRDENVSENFLISIIASLPHSLTVDKQREKISDKMAQLKHSSNYFGNKGERYKLSVEVLDVKYIQTSSVYMITTVYAGRDVIKFWWRDQPDISDIIKDKNINIVGTVNKHENSKYTGCKETMLNRVKFNAGS